MRNPPKGIRVVTLFPRNSKYCGEDLDARWKMFEKNGLGTFGRIEICGQCLRESVCLWPRQFGKYLKGAKVIFGTQWYLEHSPYFLNQITQWTGAKNPLVILDENNLIMKSFQRRINLEKLQIFANVLNKVHLKRQSKFHEEWKYHCDLLLTAPTSDLRSSDWQLPRINIDWSIAIQSYGFNLYKESFTFLAFDLINFCKSPLESRERTRSGDILYASVPCISYDFIIYSGTAHQQLSEYRLGKELASPFKDYTFKHPQTTWVNIASKLGMRSYFKKNSTQILDFYAKLVARRLQEGKRPLLITKKYFRDLCTSEIGKMLRALGINARIVTDGWNVKLLKEPNIIPLIHYGMIGTNLFEDFDCAYCLTGFYVEEDAVNGILQDLFGSDMQIPLKISTEGRPYRRKAGALNESDRVYDLHTLAQPALDQLEMGTVIQTVGRVRPYTKPREVITFQCAENPEFEYTEEFTNFKEARKYFDIHNNRSSCASDTRSQILQAKQGGLKQREAANQLGVSTRTIKRYWNS